MTEPKPNKEAENQRRAEQLRSDLLPACPRCNDLCPVGSVWCAECGTRLMVAP